MADSTSQQLQKYYDSFCDKDIIFTKEVIKTLRLELNQIFIKGAEEQWSCVIYSTSFKRAAIIVDVNSPAMGMLRDERGNVSLRFSFARSRGGSISFFVTAKVTEIAPYGNSKDFVLIKLAFVQHSPDDLIEIIGQLSEAAINAVQRAEERVPLNADAKRKLGLIKPENIVYIQGAPQRCLLREISFGSAWLVFLNPIVPQINEKVVLRLEFDNLDEPVDILGVVQETQSVNEATNISIVTIRYNPPTIPLTYTLFLSTFLTRTSRERKPAAGDFSR
ncbi:MAG: pilus assembly protein PilZ [Spirochaetaceae bacterium]|jgi:hypothetical protein|nr:pilus assembly protein PilZ [Spirochaetaceae bacterium]